jgi:hypothetical protein
MQMENDSDVADFDAHGENIHRRHSWFVLPTRRAHIVQRGSNVLANGLDVTELGENGCERRVQRRFEQRLGKHGANVRAVLLRRWRDFPATESRTPSK